MIRRSAIAVCLGLASVQPAAACGVALLLAVDVSGSVDPFEYDIQMKGLATALRDDSIAEALVVEEAAVSLLQWTGQSRQHMSIPWRRIVDFEDIDALADEVERTPRKWRNFSTAIGEALQVAMRAFVDVPDCERRIIDVSGDGRSNEGVQPNDMHDVLNAADITVNGLAIEETDGNLTEYYRNFLITGPGAFAMTAATYEIYPDRIRQKLLRELTKQLSQTDP
ncbi:DUF1194 domain-containing protein [Litoreibacter roseus]|uniref:VWFA domain-containing protein n=1 Tax=Litoreibacter roseus TaxID=2601869 RepID=A0A6N6JDL0_9RHOB|nr:DUF1194 domain-containing protein [Litoreibacter roseus]GFE63282.1 hypothetical protein KIN_03560 [Litoreibacter roseus]